MAPQPLALHQRAAIPISSRVSFNSWLLTWSQRVGCPARLTAKALALRLNERQTTSDDEAFPSKPTNSLACCCGNNPLILRRHLPLTFHLETHSRSFAFRVRRYASITADDVTDPSDAPPVLPGGLACWLTVVLNPGCLSRSDAPSRVIACRRIQPAQRSSPEA